MNHTAIIDEIASQADDFLAGADNRAQARAGVFELINADYPHLGPDARDEVAAKVMAILEEEGFFEAEPGGEGGAAATAGEDE